MAEKVQQRIEKRLPELEDLLVKELFTQDERVTQKADYLRYIEYEINLEQLRVKRKSRLSKKPKDSVSDFAGIKHIHNLFQKALFKFKGDVLLWLQYIDFSQKQGSNRRLAQIFADVLRLHPTKEVFWIQAATWEFSTNFNTEAARNLFQRGLRLNPKSQTLWLEYFRLELKFTEKIKLRRKLLLKRHVSDVDPENSQSDASTSSHSDQEESNILSLGDKQVQELSESDPILSGALSQAVYRNAIEDIPYDVEFRVRFLEIYSLFSGNQEGIQLVYDSLLRDFPEDARAVDLTIRLPLEKYSAGSKDYISALEKCVAKYDDALASSFTSRLTLFYGEFLRNCLAENEDASLKTYLQLKLKSVLSSARKRAQEDADTVLSPELYEFYIVVLRDVFSKVTQARKVADEASRLHPGELGIWKLFLSLVPEQENDERLLILETALNHCCSSVELWNMYLESYISSMNGQVEDSDREKHEKLFLDSLRKLSALHLSCEEAKEQRDRAKDTILKHLLSWAFQAGGILYVRSLSERVASVCPLSADFYRQWIKIELSYYHENPNGDKAGPKDQAMLDSFRSLFDQRQAQIASETLKRIVSLYENMVELVPSDISCWLEYLAFLDTAGSPHQGSSALYRAKSLLDPNTYFQLERDYADFQKHRSLESN
ncbi:U3 snoRNP protein [Entomophthora muscae]|uniref:U3 snoRNP protein n=1 Tax=Entomophthora muscae TaxID=34485 RepID=A0ACC2UDF1_9FUNG|nr:U3 snoRNP protein [Entomophthora muscae]